MKLIFMGTPDFAVVTLDTLVKAGHEIALVVTQPDKPRGRSGAPAPSDVKAYALEHNLPVFQPKRIREEDAVKVIQEVHADAAVVAAFGQILPKEILDAPRLGCINVHASLLPKYRGAAPIQWAVLNGDKTAGVTTMQMGVGLDDGDMLLKREIALDPWETGGSLFDRLAIEGGELAVETLAKLDANVITAIPQNEEEATHVGMIRKELGELDFTRPAAVNERYIRGLNPWPSAFTTFQGKSVKVWKAGVLADEQEAAFDERESQKTYNTIGSSDVAPGCVFSVVTDAVLVKCSEGLLRLDELQIAGKKRMKTEDFLRGHKVEPGDILG